jgi:CRISPR-associated protein Csx3
MTTSYNINLAEGGILKVGFGAPAQNDQIVREARTRLDEMIANGELAGGDVIRVNGPASLPVAMVLAHRLAHLYGAIGCFDPKLGRYVVAISHDPSYAVGDLID